MFYMDSKCANCFKAWLCSMHIDEIVRFTRAISQLRKIAIGLPYQIILDQNYFTSATYLQQHRKKKCEYLCVCAYLSKNILLWCKDPTSLVLFVIFNRVARLLSVLPHFVIWRFVFKYKSESPVCIYSSWMDVRSWLHVHTHKCITCLYLLLLLLTRTTFCKVA